MNSIEKDIEPDIDIICELTLSLDSIAYFNNYENVFIVDTVIAKTNSIGEVHAFPLDKYKPSLHLENMHDVSLPALIELAKKLDYQLPDNIVIITINILDNLTIKNKFSSDLIAGYDNILGRIKTILGKQLTPGIQQVSRST